MAATCPIPEGMELPEDLVPGGSFEAMASVKLNEDGTISITALDGNPLPDAKYEKEVAAEEPGFLEAVESGMV